MYPYPWDQIVMDPTGSGTPPYVPCLQSNLLFFSVFLRYKLQLAYYQYRRWKTEVQIGNEEKERKLEHLEGEGCS